MLYELLKERKAVGKKNALKTSEILEALHTSTRVLKRMVAEERRQGKLICSALNCGGGYYLPASLEEIEEQNRRLEKGFISRADAVRAFRRACRKAAAS